MAQEPDADDEFIALGKQIGQFYRRAHLFYQRLRFDPPLDRAAYTLLARIVGDGPARLTALADDLVLDLSTVSRQVAALEAAGLATRTPDSADRRASVIVPTDLGRRTFGRNRAVWVAALRDLLTDWTPQERRDFARLFARLNENITARYGGTEPAAGCPRAEGELSR